MLHLTVFGFLADQSLEIMSCFNFLFDVFSATRGVWSLAPLLERIACTCIRELQSFQTFAWFGFLCIFKTKLHASISANPSSAVPQNNNVWPE